MLFPVPWLAASPRGIYRVSANPEETGKTGGTSLAAAHPSVLVPGAALGSVPALTLSSVQTDHHHSTLYPAPAIIFLLPRQQPFGQLAGHPSEAPGPHRAYGPAGKAHRLVPSSLPTGATCPIALCSRTVLSCFTYLATRRRASSRIRRARPNAVGLARLVPAFHLAVALWIEPVP